MNVVGLGPGDFIVLVLCAVALAAGLYLAGKSVLAWFLGVILVLGAIYVGLGRLDVFSGGVILLIQALVLIVLAASLARSPGAANRVVGVLGIIAGAIVVIVAFPGFRSLGIDGTIGDIIAAGWQSIVNIFKTANRA